MTWQNLSNSALLSRFVCSTIDVRSTVQLVVGCGVVGIHNGMFTGLSYSFLPHNVDVHVRNGHDFRRPIRFGGYAPILDSLLPILFRIRRVNFMITPNEWRHFMFQCDGRHTGIATSMVNAKRFVQIQMTHVSTILSTTQSKSVFHI